MSAPFDGIDAVVTDIEGTTGSIAFVKDVLFPYADEHLATFLEEHRNEPAVRALLDEAARIAGVGANDDEAILAALRAWIRDDRKVTPLKALQGMIWARGYHDGALRGDVYPDAVHGLERLKGRGIDLYVFSSGSVAAQKLIFGYSVAGDLTALFDGYFDTTVGPKTESASYVAIANRIAREPHRILFLSDSIPELDAARAAGFQTVHVVRDGPLPNASAHPSIRSFDELQVRSNENV